MGAHDGPKSPDERAVEQRRTLAALKKRAKKRGVVPGTVKKLIKVINEGGGLSFAEKVARRRRKIARSIGAIVDRHHADHERLHGLLDPDGPLGCDSSAGGGCSSSDTLLREHYELAVRLESLAIEALGAEVGARTLKQRFEELDQIEETRGGAIEALRNDADFNHREIALLCIYMRLNLLVERNAHLRAEP